MTSYTRSPKKTVARCPVAGCKWMRIYFRRGGAFTEAEEVWTPKARAAAVLRSHKKMHKAKVLINGR